MSTESALNATLDCWMLGIGVSGHGRKEERRERGRQREGEKAVNIRKVKDNKLIFSCRIGIQHQIHSHTQHSRNSPNFLHRAFDKWLKVAEQEVCSFVAWSRCSHC